MQNKELFSQMLEKAASNNGLKLILSSTGKRSAFQVEENPNVMFRLNAGGLEANPLQAVDLSEDKVLCSYVLQKAHIPAIQHLTLTQQVYTELVKSADSIEKQVLKPRYGLGGKSVSILETALDLDRITPAMLEEKKMCVSPFYDAQVEYRITVIDGEVKYMYGKVRNPETMQHNLAKGATICWVPEEIKENLANIAIAATKAVGLHLANVDILHYRDAFIIMEVNASITLSGVLAEYPERFDEIVSVYTEMLKVAKREALNRHDSKLALQMM